MPAARLLREASLKVPIREAEPEAIAPKPTSHKAAEPPKIADMKAAKPAATKPVKAPQAQPAANDKKAGDKKSEVAARPVTKPIRVAKVDPLAPLSTKANLQKTVRDFGSAR
jgi:hypothetical protein